MPRASRRYQSVFEANQSLDFEVFDAMFKNGLRNLVKYVDNEGGIPALTSTYNGFEVGKWLHGLQDNPHVLDVSNRAVLLSIPGVRLTKLPRRDQRVVIHTSPARRVLWERLRAWSVDPMTDPIHARRVAASKGR